MPRGWPLQPKEPTEQSCGSMVSAPGSSPVQTIWDNGTHVQPECDAVELLELHTCGRHLTWQHLRC